jgi:hypothetical protein
MNGKLKMNSNLQYLVSSFVDFFYFSKVPLDKTCLDAAERARQNNGKTMMAKSGAIQACERLEKANITK